MRIFINNFNLDLLDEIERILKEKQTGFESYMEVNTNEGIYRIIDNKLYLLEQIDKDISILKNFYDNFTLIVDPSYFKEVETTSILGETHLHINIENKIYQSISHR